VIVRGCSVLFHRCLVFELFFFLFSSRRRHTRSYGDWSSDVCSSDLMNSILTVISGLEFMAVSLRFAVPKPFVAAGPCVHPVKVRSEERRVGKECKWRRSSAPSTKKKRSRLRIARMKRATTGSDV